MLIMLYVLDEVQHLRRWVSTPGWDVHAQLPSQVLSLHPHNADRILVLSSHWEYILRHLPAM